jgi:hypothetical protein
MLSSNAQSATTGIVERVNNEVDGKLNKQDCLLVSIACTLPQDREEILGLMLPPKFHKRVMEPSQSISITLQEWGLLFGTCSAYLQVRSTCAIVEQKGFKDCMALLQEALRCSLSEKTAALAWNNPAVKIACYVSLYSSSCDAWLNTVLGGLMRGDKRRLDDLRADVEDKPTDPLLLSLCISFLASCIA